MLFIEKCRDPINFTESSVQFVAKEVIFIKKKIVILFLYCFFYAHTSGITAYCLYRITI